MPTHLSAADIKAHGVVFTPPWVVGACLDLVGLTPDVAWKSRVIDPACGDGAFMREVARRLIAGGRAAGARVATIRRRLELQLWGFELDATTAAHYTREMSALAEREGIPQVRWSVRVGDSLDRDTVEASFWGSFDFVVGNPPYVRIQHLGVTRRTKLRATWPTMNQGSSDLYFGFYELATQLAKPTTGRVSYITPNSFFHSAAGARLRAHLTQAHQVRAIVDFKDHQVFDGALTYATILVLESAAAPVRPVRLFRPAAADVAAQRIGAEETLDVRDLEGSARWVVLPTAESRAVKADQAQGVPLGEVARISTGLATLADKYFIFKELTQHANGDVEGLLPDPTAGPKATRRVRLERGLLKPILKASTLKVSAAGRIVPQKLWILFPYQKSAAGKHVILPEATLQRQYPRGWAYLCSIRSILEQRDKGAKTYAAWYAFGRTQGLDTTFGPKILTSPFNPAPNFIVSLDPDTTFYSGYSITPRTGRITATRLRALAAELNSERMATYIARTSKDYQSGWKSYAKAFIKDFGVIGDAS